MVDQAASRVSMHYAPTRQAYRLQLSSSDLVPRLPCDQLCYRRISALTVDKSEGVGIESQLRFRRS